MPKSDGADLERTATCELQNELGKRAGVRAVAIDERARLTVIVDGQVVDDRRGPLTVTVNWD